MTSVHLTVTAINEPRRYATVVTLPHLQRVITKLEASGEYPTQLAAFREVAAQRAQDVAAKAEARDRWEQAKVETRAWARTLDELIPFLSRGDYDQLYDLAEQEFDMPEFLTLLDKARNARSYA